MQHRFQFAHEQPSLSLFCLEEQWEDRFEELDTHLMLRETCVLTETP
ncbi:MAG TPA: hypothetical protein VL485_26800 [Ktedonobacteraceae bacterium]|jgi:hypothetical protein|nr:hypothetical protein [Ktedonobacteraceae bacterium]